MKLVHLAVPQQVSVWRPRPPHSPLLGTHCNSELKSIESSKFGLPSKLVAPPWLALSSSANCCSSTHFMTPSPMKLVHPC